MAGRVLLLTASAPNYPWFMYYASVRLCAFSSKAFTELFVGNDGGTK